MGRGGVRCQSRGSYDELRGSYFETTRGHLCYNVPSPDSSLLHKSFPHMSLGSAGCLSQSSLLDTHTQASLCCCLSFPRPVLRSPNWFLTSWWWGMGSTGQFLIRCGRCEMREIKAEDLALPLSWFPPNPTSWCLTHTGLKMWFSKCRVTQWIIYSRS